MWPQQQIRVQTLVGLLICAAGLPILGASVWQELQSQPSVQAALLGGLVAALATALGTLPVLLAQKPSARLQDSMLGFGAGVMLAASAFSLVIPAIEAARGLGTWGGGAWSAGLAVGAAVLLGGAVLLLVDKVLPHEHFLNGREGASVQQVRRTWLFIFAIMLHNLPEGLAIGVGFAGSDDVRANTLTMGIAVQDVPEGFVVAAALLAAGYSRGFAVLLGAASGLMEPVGAVIGATAMGYPELLPWGLGFAAGAMLFVVSHEIIPESHRKGHEAFATTGLMAGFVLMMVLDTALV